MGDRAPFPSAAAIAQAEKLTREPFLHAGETQEEALAPGTPRRRALDAAIAEVEQGLKIPSLDWRREFSLMMGLERVLSEDEPRLADGTMLNPHQVDALSGTLTALLAQMSGGVAEVVAAGSQPPADAGKGPRSAAAGTRRPPSKRSSATEDDLDEAEDDFDDDDAEDLDDHIDDDDLDDVDLDEDDEDDDESDHDDEDDDHEDDDVEAHEDHDDHEDHEPEPEDLDDHEEPEDFTEEDNALDADVLIDVEDPGADRRFWFEHATGAGKTVAAMGFVEATRTGGVLILTHRRNLVDQFIDEIKTRGYKDRLCAPLLIGQDAANGPVTVETYQWFVRNAGKISDAYTVVICDEAHTALGEKTSAQIRSWDKPVWIGMTATGALIARHVTDLFPTQTSRFDLSQAARRGVIAPLRCIRIPPGVGVRTIAKVPLRRGEVDTEFDQEMLAELLDQTPFNLAIADLYKTRFNGLPGVVYAAGVKHAYNVAEAFRSFDMKAMAVSGETPKRELAKILADYEAGKIDVLVNAQLLAEGWNSPRATVCMHLAPTASKRIYQQRVGRVTRRHQGKEAGIVVDFVHPATKHDDPVVTLHSLLDRDVYRGGAIVVGPVRRGRGRRIRVERRVLPVTPDQERRAEVFERELWRIAVEHLDYGEQHVWAALAGARVQPNGWRRAKAMLHFDRQGELRRRYLLTALQRNKSAQLRLRALQEISAARDAEAFDTAIDTMANWPRDERREGVKIMLLALAERRIGRRDQANAWIWRMAEYTRDVHEEYAAQRWPETKRLLGLLVNSSGSAHARNARRLVHATRTQDRRLSAALLAAALAHTPEAEEALRGARTRMARKPAALARELLRNFPKGKKSSKRRRKAKSASGEATAAATAATAEGAATTDATTTVEGTETSGGTAVLEAPAKPSRNRRRRRVRTDDGGSAANGSDRGSDAPDADIDAAREDVIETGDAEDTTVGLEIEVKAAAAALHKPAPKPRARRTRSRAAKPPVGTETPVTEAAAVADTPAGVVSDTPPTPASAEPTAPTEAAAGEAPATAKPTRARKPRATRAKPAPAETPSAEATAAEVQTVSTESPETTATESPAKKPRAPRKPRATKATTDAAPEAEPATLFDAPVTEAAKTEASPTEASGAEPATAESAAPAAPVKKPARKPRATKPKAEPAAAAEAPAAETKTVEPAGTAAAQAPVKKPRAPRKPRATATKAATDAAAAAATVKPDTDDAAPDAEPTAAAAPAKKPRAPRKPRTVKPKATAEATSGEPGPEGEPERDAA